MPSAKTKAVVLATAVTAALATGATAATAAPAAKPQATSKPKSASVTGTGSFRLTYAPDADIRAFTIDAHAAPYSRPMPGSSAPDGLPTDARGTVKISHYVAAHHTTVRMDAEVDCLVTSPGNATLTAKVVRADAPVSDWVGRRVGLSVNDRGHDWVGLSWSVTNATQNEQGGWEEAEVGTCMAPAAFAPVTKGGFTVRHADLPEPPQK